jgi:hypothetical protein
MLTRSGLLRSPSPERRGSWSVEKSIRNQPGGHRAGGQAAASLGLCMSLSSLIYYIIFWHAAAACTTAVLATSRLLRCWKWVKAGGLGLPVWNAGFSKGKQRNGFPLETFRWQLINRTWINLSNRALGWKPLVLNFSSCNFTPFGTRSHAYRKTWKPFFFITCLKQFHGDMPVFRSFVQNIAKGGAGGVLHKKHSQWAPWKPWQPQVQLQQAARVKAGM